MSQRLCDSANCQKVQWQGSSNCRLCDSKDWQSIYEETAQRRSRTGRDHAADLPISPQWIEKLDAVHVVLTAKMSPATAGMYLTMYVSPSPSHTRQEWIIIVIRQELNPVTCRLDRNRINIRWRLYICKITVDNDSIKQQRHNKLYVPPAAS